jgi:Ca2+-dependent lipid-binding protein
VRVPTPLPHLKLVINIISAGMIPKAHGESERDIADPYVNVYINGVLADKAKAKTKTISNNGFNPIFNEIVSFVLTRPETAVVTFEIMDHNLGKDVRIGYNSFAVSSIRSGFRTVPLLSPEGSSDGDFQFSSFFIRCDLLSYEPSGK